MFFMTPRDVAAQVEGILEQRALLDRAIRLSFRSWDPIVTRRAANKHRMARQPLGTEGLVPSWAAVNANVT